MDLEKQGNHKFNFFKSAYCRQSLGFSNLKDVTDYTALFFVVMWVLSGILFRMDIKSQQEIPKVQTFASVAMNSVGTQEKLKFITQVKSLKYAKEYKDNTLQLLKEINKDLSIVITNFENNEGVLEVQGHMADSKKVELVFEGDSISVKWINVSPAEVQLFANAWKGEIGFDFRTNTDNKKETVLVANVLTMKASPIAVTSSDKIKSLKTKLEKLQQENNQLKKNNAELVVKQAVRENPHLKDQEKEIQKFVDSFVKAVK